MSTASTRMPRYFSKNGWSTMEPAMPIDTPPRERYDLPRRIAAAMPARAKRRILAWTSSGIVPSVASWTSRP